MGRCRARAAWITLRNFGRKRVLLLDPPRQEVIAAYQAADLFVFASRIEYSPLVLFEALASHTPFVSSDCGNAREIVEWSGGGWVVDSVKRPDGVVDVEPAKLARAIETLLALGDIRHKMANRGQSAWRQRFTWEKIALEYEHLYMQIIENRL